MIERLSRESNTVMMKMIIMIGDEFHCVSTVK